MNAGRLSCLCHCCWELWNNCHISQCRRSFWRAVKTNNNHIIRLHCTQCIVVASYHCVWLMFTTASTRKKSEPSKVLFGYELVWTMYQLGGPDRPRGRGNFGRSISWSIIKYREYPEWASYLAGGSSNQPFTDFYHGLWLLCLGSLAFFGISLCYNKAPVQVVSFCDCKPTTTTFKHDLQCQGEPASNTNNNFDNVYGPVITTKATARVHPVHLSVLR